MKLYEAELGQYPWGFNREPYDIIVSKSFIAASRKWSNREDLFRDWVSHQRTYYYEYRQEKNWVFSGYINEFREFNALNIEDYLLEY